MSGDVNFAQPPIQPAMPDNIPPTDSAVTFAKAQNAARIVGRQAGAGRARARNLPKPAKPVKKSICGARRFFFGVPDKHKNEYNTEKSFASALKLLDLTQQIGAERQSLGVLDGRQWKKDVESVQKRLDSITWAILKETVKHGGLGNQLDAKVLRPMICDMLKGLVKENYCSRAYLEQAAAGIREMLDSMETVWRLGDVKRDVLNVFLNECEAYLNAAPVPAEIKMENAKERVEMQAWPPEEKTAGNPLKEIPEDDFRPAKDIPSIGSSQMLMHSMSPGSAHDKAIFSKTEAPSQAFKKTLAQLEKHHRALDAELSVESDEKSKDILFPLPLTSRREGVENKEEYKNEFNESVKGGVRDYPLKDIGKSERWDEPRFQMSALVSARERNSNAPELAGLVKDADVENVPGAPLVDYVQGINAPPNNPCGDPLIQIEYLDNLQACIVQNLADNNIPGVNAARAAYANECERLATMLKMAPPSIATRCRMLADSTNEMMEAQDAILRNVAAIKKSGTDVSKIPDCGKLIISALSKLRVALSTRAEALKSLEIQNHLSTRSRDAIALVLEKLSQSVPENNIVNLTRRNLLGGLNELRTRLARTTATDLPGTTSQGNELRERIISRTFGPHREDEAVINQGIADIRSNKEMWRIIAERKELRQQRMDITQQMMAAVSERDRWIAVQDALTDSRMPMNDVSMSVAATMIGNLDARIVNCRRQVAALARDEKTQNERMRKFLNENPPPHVKKYLLFTETLGRKALESQTLQEANVPILSTEPNSPLKTLEEAIAVKDTGPLRRASIAEKKTIASARKAAEANRKNIETAEWEYAMTLSLGSGVDRALASPQKLMESIEGLHASIQNATLAAGRQFDETHHRQNIDANLEDERQAMRQASLANAQNGKPISTFNRQLLEQTEYLQRLANTLEPSRKHAYLAMLDASNARHRFRNAMAMGRIKNVMPIDRKLNNLVSAWRERIDCIEGRKQISPLDAWSFGLTASDYATNTIIQGRRDSLSTEVRIHLERLTHNEPDIQVLMDLLPICAPDDPHVQVIPPPKDRNVQAKAEFLPPSAISFGKIAETLNSSLDNVAISGNIKDFKAKSQQLAEGIDAIADPETKDRLKNYFERLNGCVGKADALYTSHAKQSKQIISEQSKKGVDYLRMLVDLQKQLFALEQGIMGAADNSLKLDYLDKTANLESKVQEVMRSFEKFVQNPAANSVPEPPISRDANLNRLMDAVILADDIVMGFHQSAEENMRRFAARVGEIDQPVEYPTMQMGQYANKMKTLQDMIASGSRAKSGVQRNAWKSLEESFDNRMVYQQYCVEHARQQAIFKHRLSMSAAPVWPRAAQNIDATLAEMQTAIVRHRDDIAKTDKSFGEAMHRWIAKDKNEPLLNRQPSDAAFVEEKEEKMEDELD